MDNFSIQCYSVRDHLEKDPAATYKGLKAAGYDFVELFGVGPHNAAETSQMLEAAGLQAMCAHIDYETATTQAEAAIEAFRNIGIEDVVIPWLDLDSAEKWTKAANTMDALGEKYRENGMRLGYHNHEHEFERVYDGTSAFDLILNTAAPENLFIELDAFWAETGGADPAALIRSLGDRCAMLHMKDRVGEVGDDIPVPFAEIGHGTTDWAILFEACREAGVRWYVVEQDESTRDTLESAAMSAEFMRAH